MEDCLPPPLDEPDICGLREDSLTYLSAQHRQHFDQGHSANAIERLSEEKRRSRKPRRTLDLLCIVGIVWFVLAVVVNIGLVEASVLPSVKGVEVGYTSSTDGFIHDGEQLNHGEVDEVGSTPITSMASHGQFGYESLIDADLVPSAHHAPTSHYVFYPTTIPQTLLSLLSTLKDRWLAARRTSIYLHHYRPLDVVIQEQQTGLKRRLTQTEKIEAGCIPILVILSGIFAGCTLGYFSIDPTQLQVLSVSGTPQQKINARKVMPVRSKGHLLLTTLILANMIVNEALPVVADGPLGGGIYAVIASTALVVIFAEIIPQSVCARYGLWVGAKMAWPVRVLMIFFFPVAWPIAKLLEWVLGAHHGIIYRRSELKELINMHIAGGEGGGDLDLDTVTMTRGALGLQDKNVKDAMTPIDSVFMLPITAKLDYETLGRVVKSGHSRIPVYSVVEVPDVLANPVQGGKTKMVRRVVGCLLVKQCVLLDPEDATPLSSVPINAIPMVPWDERLTNMLNAFQEGRSHMAIVSRRARYKPLEADEESIMSSAAVKMHKRLLMKISEKVRGGDGSSGSDEDDEDVGKKIGKVEKGEQGKKGSNKKTTTMIANAAKLQNQEQALPADAQLGKEGVEKFFEGLEGAPLGIITLEDVLEELIGEEIFDEYDPPSETGQPSLPASSYVPAEAQEAAEAAARRREKESSITFGNKEEETAAVAPKRTSTPIARRLPKLSVPRFPGKRTSSTPGAKRTGELVKMPEVGGGKDEKVLEGDHLTAEPIHLTRSRSEDDVSRLPESTDYQRQPKGTDMVSQSAPTSRPASTDAIRQAVLGSTPETKTPTPPPAASAVPARLLPGSVAPPNGVNGSIAASPEATIPAPSGMTFTTPTVVPATNSPPIPATLPTPLSEALLVERGRRRLAAVGGHPSSVLMNPAGPVHAPSRSSSVGPGSKAAVVGIGRFPTPTGMVVNGASLPPTPGVHGPIFGMATPPSSTSDGSPQSAVLPSVPGTTAAAAAAASGQGQGILSPIPKRTPRFKSVPAAAGAGTPVSTTPIEEGGEKKE